MISNNALYTLREPLLTSDSKPGLKLVEVSRLNKYHLSPSKSFIEDIQEHILCQDSDYLGRSVEDA